MREVRRGHSGLCSRAGSLAWGWRLEAGLGVLTGSWWRLGDLAGGPGAAVLVLGTCGISLWRMPTAKATLAEWLWASSVRRWFARALRLCGVWGPTGTAPVLRQVTSTSAGIRVRVEVPLGTHAGQLLGAGPALAAALGVREIRVTRDAGDASMANVTVVRRDPLAVGPPLAWPWVEAARTSVWDPVPAGIDEEGRVVTISLPEHNLLLGGEPGAGKSAALSLLVATAALDPSCSLTLLDGKQVELAPWRRAAVRFVGPGMAEANEVLGELRTEMDRRYALLLAAGRRKVGIGDGLGLHVVAVDELAYFLRAGTKEQRTGFAEAFRDLVSRGRAAGIVVLAATQRPSHEIVPTSIRDLFSFRLALRCTTPESSDTVLGQGWAAQGYSAATVDPANRGVGFLLHEGGVPVKLRSYYLGDDDVVALARRAAALRGRE